MSWNDNDDDYTDEDNEDKRWIPVNEIMQILKDTEKMLFYSWVKTKYTGEDIELKNKAYRKMKMVEFLEQLRTPSTPFVLALLNEFHPKHNTFRELVEFAIKETENA